MEVLQVLRQYSIAMGLGQKRPKPKRGTKPKLGTEGEDIVKDEAGHVTLVAPARFGLGTVKGAAYKVLQDVGPEGLTITEIARRIQEQGLRDLTTSKTPEVSMLCCCPYNEHHSCRRGKASMSLCSMQHANTCSVSQCDQ